MMLVLLLVPVLRTAGVLRGAGAVGIPTPTLYRPHSTAGAHSRRPMTGLSTDMEAPAHRIKRTMSHILLASLYY